MGHRVGGRGVGDPPVEAGSVVRMDGWTDPRFERVREVFRRNFVDEGEVGAAFEVWHQGAPVVQLWGGLSDPERGRAWTRDTACVLFSATKGIVATAFLMLVDRGEIALDEPVATWWPEFAAEGKARITVRMLLNHRAGLFAIEPWIRVKAFAAPESVDEVLAVQRPLAPPGRYQAYGATAWGAYVGALFRKVTGQSVGQWVAEHIAPHVAGPLRLGLPVDDPLAPAQIIPVSRRTLLTEQIPHALTTRTAEARLARRVLTGRTAWSGKALWNPVMGRKMLGAVNERWILALELPWMNAVGSAGALARMYAMIVGEVDGHRLVSPAAVEPLRERQTWSERDGVLHKPMGWAQGFVKEAVGVFSPNPASFGHPGAGGAFGWADPDAELAMAYVPNRMDWRIRSPRALALAGATTACL